MISYQESARETVEVQGIQVSFSTEFESGSMPETVDVKGNGRVPEEGAGKEGTRYVNFTGKYDVGGGVFSFFQGSHVPGDFVEAVSVKAAVFCEQVKADRGGVA